jgi:hypothetical protein
MAVIGWIGYSNAEFTALSPIQCDQTGALDCKVPEKALLCLRRSNKDELLIASQTVGGIWTDDHASGGAVNGNDRAMGLLSNTTLKNRFPLERTRHLVVENVDPFCEDDHILTF